MEKKTTNAFMCRKGAADSKYNVLYKSNIKDNTYRLCSERVLKQEEWDPILKLENEDFLSFTSTKKYIKAIAEKVTLGNYTGLSLSGNWRYLNIYLNKDNYIRSWMVSNFPDFGSSVIIDLLGEEPKEEKEVLDIDSNATHYPSLERKVYFWEIGPKGTGKPEDLAQKGLDKFTKEPVNHCSLSDGVYIVVVDKNWKAMIFKKENILGFKEEIQVIAYVSVIESIPYYTLPESKGKFVKIDSLDIDRDLSRLESFNFRTKWPEINMVILSYPIEGDINHVGMEFYNNIKTMAIQRYASLTLSLPNTKLEPLVNSLPAPEDKDALEVERVFDLIDSNKSEDTTKGKSKIGKLIKKGLEGFKKTSEPSNDSEEILKAYEWLKSSNEKSICVSTKDSGVIKISKL